MRHPALTGAWRPLFILSALALLVGGPQHPGGTMAEMLAHPAWVRSHAIVLLGFVLLLIGLILYRRSNAWPDRTSRWARWAIIGTALQAVEMALHTAASVDHANLVAGNPTPVLTTHLRLAVVLYPAFSLSFIGLVIAGVRDRTLGSRWIAWLGILGALAHGAAPPLVGGLGIEDARILFPLLILVALWLLLAALWPAGAAAPGVSDAGRQPQPIP